MPTCTKPFKLLLSLFLLFGTMLSGGPAARAQSVILYTPYTEISVPPGKSIDYSIDVVNNSSAVRTVEIALSGLPENWTYGLTSGGWEIGQISVMPGEKKNLSLKVEVPLKIDKGTYRFKVLAKGYHTLPLTVDVSEQGTFKSKFSTQQANMEGGANSTFTFNASLQNSTAEDQVYALRARAPRGWNVAFKANYKQVSSVNVKANQTQDITVEVDPPDQIKAGTYKVPLLAAGDATSANLELEVVVTGSYSMELSTPKGLLSTSITAGDDKRVELVVKNTGSAQLKDIDMSFSAPVNWDVVFEPEKVEVLDPGKTAQVFATIKAADKAIAGDYVTNLEAKTPEASSEAAFRVSVRTPLLWGWMGILIILAALGGVYYLFRKYGRR